MIGGLTALILLSTVSQTIPYQIPLTVAAPGDNVALTCPVDGDDTVLFYWYKLRFGHMVQTIAAGSVYKTSLQGQFNNSRFTLTKVNAEFFLNIRNVSKEDEATYACQTGAAYVMKFTSGTVLAVNDHNNQKSSVYVMQTPDTVLVESGGLMTLQCSILSKSQENADQCPGEHNVFWFKAGSAESPPAIIYTHRNRSDEEEERSCTHSLSKTIRDSSDNGTYYCAVVTCGEILFGEGTKVDTRRDLWPFVIVLGTLLTCCLIVIVVLIISRNQKPVCKHRKGDVAAFNYAEHDRSAEDQSNDLDGGAMALNYAALDFPSRKRERWMNSRDIPDNCMYSGMIDCQ